MSDTENKSYWNTIKDLSKANKIWSATKGYGIDFNTSKSTLVAIVQTAEKKSSALRSIVRFDKAHKGANYNHINVNHRISGIPDPHIPLPSGGIQAVQGTAVVLKALNKFNNYFVFPLAIAYETYDTVWNINKDVNNKTTRNTVEKVTNLVGTTGGGYAGAVTGGMIGSAILPGIGTVVGSLIGSITGSLGSSYTVDMITTNISERCEYGIVKKNCEFCGKQMEFRKYQGEQTNSYCGGDTCGNNVYILYVKRIGRKKYECCFHQFLF